MNETPVTLKNTVELPVNPANQVSVSMGRAAVTSRTVTTVGTSVSPFSENVEFLSDRPIRRPESRRLG